MDTTQPWDGVDLHGVTNFLQKNWDAFSHYEILNVYLFGSRLYGTYTDESDFDFIVIVDGVWSYFIYSE